VREKVRATYWLVAMPGENLRGVIGMQQRQQLARNMRRATIYYG